MADGSNENDIAMIDIADLVSQYHRGMYQYAFRLTGSAVDAEDLVQESFLIAQQKLDQLRSEKAARSWLFTILRNCFIRSRKRSRPISAGSIELNIDSVPQDTSRDEEIDSERLQHALNQLPPKHRTMLAMFYFEDIPYREIARQLDMPIGTVMSRLARAKSRLRTELFKLDDQNVGESHHQLAAPDQ
ncbi:MAG: sigma-70 family RNA polymerase sigma factor [Pirellulales bacterium]|nr:sigma-70 family RNA polymerase sigma factor [Pirellulales bacterium]